MKLKFKGKVLFANGAPATGVTVRVFDSDADHNQDDDLTLSPGLTDDQGRFALTYNPARFIDMVSLDTSSTASQPFDTTGPRLPDLTDLYLPYLRFDYPFRNQPRQHQAWLMPFQKEFHLPEYPTLRFSAAQHGFRFPNRFAGYFIPFSTPVKFAPKKVPPSYGLCGGMSSAALDFKLAGREIPATADIPRGGSRLQRYLFRRQMDSMGALGSTILKVAQWTTLPDETALGLKRLTFDEFTRIRPRLEDQNPVVLGLIYVHASSASELIQVIFNNHQVLAHAIEQRTPLDYTIHVYDPNYPQREDVSLLIRQVPVIAAGSGEPPKGLQVVQMIGAQGKPVRGFFAMPYTYIEPPKKL